MNPIAQALYNRRIRRETRRYQELARLNASERSQAGLAAVTAAIATMRAEGI